MAEDEQYEDAQALLGRLMEGMAGQLSAMVGETLRPERWQYAMVPWAEVNELAGEGWKLLAAHYDLTRFVMAKQLGPAEQAAELLKMAAAEREFGVPHIMTPGEST